MFYKSILLEIEMNGPDNKCVYSLTDYVVFIYQKCAIRCALDGRSCMGLN